MSDTPFAALETARLRIRRFTEADLPTLHAYRNDEEVARFQGWDGSDEGVLLQFILTMMNVSPDTVGDWVQLAVEEKATHTHIGDIGVHRLAEEPHEAEIAYTFARSAQGQGYAGEAVRGVLDFLFNEVKLHRITALIYADNPRSIALVERLGFRKEAHYRKSARRDREWVDDVLYAILEEEWV
jgi:RimJ/RimL family protein N-acetyltransferase